MKIDFFCLKVKFQLNLFFSNIQSDTEDLLTQEETLIFI